MKKSYLKTQLWTVLICSLLVFANFYSCKKDKECECNGENNGNYTEKSLIGTTWESDFFKCDYVEEGVQFLQCSKITISFKEGVNDGKKYYLAEITNEFSDVMDLETLRHYSLTIYTSAEYTVDGKNINIRLYSDNYGGNWTGTVEKDKMTLKNVFGKTVEFRKIQNE
jgi:hypothetical protein